jgi:hypothetical protein
VVVDFVFMHFTYAIGRSPLGANFALLDAPKVASSEAPKKCLFQIADNKSFQCVAASFESCCEMILDEMLALDISNHESNPETLPDRSSEASSSDTYMKSSMIVKIDMAALRLTLR